MLLCQQRQRTSILYGMSMDQFPIQDFGVLTSKSKLSLKIKCSLRSIHNYHEIASIYVDDFLIDYPAIDNKIITSAPLTQYQCWVIFRIHQFLKLIPKAELLKHTLENDPNVQFQYSKAQFELIYPELKEESNNESQAICRIA